MSEEAITLRYDGPALADHKMDLAHLAPALFALGDLCKLANKTFNQDRASVRVLVNVDREQQCFEFGLELVFTYWEQARALIHDARVRDAKELAELLGLIAGPPASGWGLFKLLKWLRGRKPEFQTVQDQDGKDLVQVTVKGDNNTINVTPETERLYKNPSAIRSAKKVLDPLTEEGYESLEFTHAEKVTERFDKDDAKEITKAPLPDLQEYEEPPQ